MPDQVLHDDIEAEGDFSRRSLFGLSGLSGYLVLLVESFA
jgi:hypothetical protein